MQISLSVSLFFPFFFKYERSISRCRSGTKGLVGVGTAQMNTSQESILASHWCSALQNQNSYQGSMLGFFLRLFQSMPLSWKSLQVNTTKMTRSIAVHDVLRFPTKFVAEKLGRFPILRNFSSYSDNFPKLTSASLGSAGQRVSADLASTAGCSPLAIWLPRVQRGTRAAHPGLSPWDWHLNCPCDILRRAPRCGCSLLTELLKNQ